jgi:hypothetical protein
VALHVSLNQSPTKLSRIHYCCFCFILQKQGAAFVLAASAKLQPEATIGTRRAIFLNYYLLPLCPNIK